MYSLENTFTYIYVRVHVCMYMCIYTLDYYFSHLQLIKIRFLNTNILSKKLVILDKYKTKICIVVYYITLNKKTWHKQYIL